MRKKRRLQRILRKMKLLACLILAGFCTCHAALNAQNYKIDLSVTNTSLTAVFRQIEQLTDYMFVYKSADIQPFQSITIDCRQTEVSRILDDCLAGTGLSYSFKDNLIVIQSHAPVHEERKVKGKVIDMKKQPLPGVTVLLKGTNLGTATNADGIFTLTLTSLENVVLVFSCIGMETKEIELDGKGNEEELVVTLPELIESLDDVVVTGYLNVRKESYTGTAVRINGKDLLKVANRNIISAIQVFDPSFRVMEYNEKGSDPNAVPEFYIRGHSGISNLDIEEISEARIKNNSNLPIFILDGLEVSVEKIYDMDPQRIHSITILKDAAATAIYGSQASNGVVVVETVSPKAGKFNVSYNLTGTLTTPDITSYDYFNASEKLEVEKKAGYYDIYGYGVRAVYKELNKKQMAIKKGVDTDWLALPLRVGYNHKHSVAIDGGNDNIRYGVNLFYDQQKGVMKKDLRERVGTELRIDYRLSNLNIINRISYNRVFSKNSPYGSYASFVKQLPYNELYDEFGNYLYTFTSWHDGVPIVNPMYEGSVTKNYDKTVTEDFANNLLVDFYFNEHLAIKAQFGIARQISSRKNFVDPASGKFASTTYQDALKGSLSTLDRKSFNWTTNLLLRYNRSIALNYINASLGLNVSEQKKSSLGVNYRGFPSGNLSSVMYAQEVIGKPLESDNHTRLVGVFARLNYSYDDIYLLDASLRLDGSSEFGTDQRFAPFWSTGIGINFHNYSFLKDNRILNQLKLTATYGQTGKLNFPPYAAKDIYEVFSDKWYATGMGVKLMALGNSGLKWEKKNSYDLKLELGIFDGLFYAQLAYYNAKTTDMITSIAIPSSFGFVSYYDNLGEVENIGYELNLRSVLLRKNDWYLSLYGNMAHNKNKILKIANSLKRYNEQVDEYYKDYSAYKEKYAKSFTKYVEGGSTTSIFGMKSLGIDPTSGYEVFVRKDGTITYEWEPNEQQILGNSLPKLQGAFGVNLQWRNWTLFASFLYEWGGQIYNSTLPIHVESVDLYNYNADRRVLSDRWQEVGDITPLKHIADRRSYSRPTSRFVQDNNVLRLNSLSLSWAVSDGFVKRWRLNQLKLQLSMNDVAHWSTVKQERGIDYPFARSFDFSLGLSF